MSFNYQNVKFIKSVLHVKLSPNVQKLPEIIFIGKSNAGKSSLINAICNNKKLAKVSSTPGATKFLNYFLIDEQCYFIDAPGYGFVSDRQSDFSKMMSSIFSSRYLKGIIFVLDSRRRLSVNDKVFYNFLIDKKIPFFIVLTKSDKITQREKHVILNDIHNCFTIVKNDELLFFNLKNKSNIDLLKNKIEYLLSK